MSLHHNYDVGYKRTELFVTITKLFSVCSNCRLPLSDSVPLQSKLELFFWGEILENVEFCAALSEFFQKNSTFFSKNSKIYCHFCSINFRVDSRNKLKGDFDLFNYTLLFVNYEFVSAA